MRDLALGGVRPAELRAWRATGAREMFAPARHGHKEAARRREIDRLRALGLDTGDDSISQMPYLMVAQQQQQQQQLATTTAPAGA